MKTLFLILGVQDLLIWGFDYKNDYDAWTWLWLATGILFIILSVVVKRYRVQQQLHGSANATPKSDKSDFV